MREYMSCHGYHEKMLGGGRSIDIDNSKTSRMVAEYGAGGDQGHRTKSQEKGAPSSSNNHTLSPSLASTLLPLTIMSVGSFPFARLNLKLPQLRSLDVLADDLSA
jgi:hypothetical protein